MFKLGLNVRDKASKGVSKSAPGKRKPLLDNDVEDVKGKSKEAAGAEEISEFNFDETSASTSKPDKRPPIRKVQAKTDDPTLYQNSASTRESEKKAQEAMELDPSLYDYDTAYDAIHAQTTAKRAAEREDAAEKRPKYMQSLFESAEVRKKDQLRARDKLLQREREAEGDEFADKEKFVTGAYKQQQEETRKAEEEEKKKQEAEEERRRKTGMQGFHRQMLMEEEKRHQAAMDAAAEVAKNGVKPVLDEPKEKSDAEIARELNAQGKNIILNEEGQVADKRQLLGAGLNIVARPKRANASATAPRPGAVQTVYPDRNSGQRATRERQTLLIAQQIEQAAKRKADEEAEEQRKIAHASKSQKTEGEITSARERYLQRKKEKEAAAAMAAAEK
ncbi:hypothetical protein CC78DRAFT_557447 [Lojkania enalia]|uniref:Nuclear speckle splicing regulatory protein 1 N-terminal domain-containing protein n=1 Tax=Lojkania enalia TaxID=147567 RepID=A0A9P4NBD5_9PLEO|nr:hypothetical protein CC78DRAFT_557447 [Didymosphaeria enalia]